MLLINSFIKMAFVASLSPVLLTKTQQMSKDNFQPFLTNTQTPLNGSQWRGYSLLVHCLF